MEPVCILRCLRYLPSTFVAAGIPIEQSCQTFLSSTPADMAVNVYCEANLPSIAVEQSHHALFYRCQALVSNMAAQHICQGWLANILARLCRQDPCQASNQLVARCIACCVYTTHLRSVHCGMRMLVFKLLTGPSHLHSCHTAHYVNTFAKRRGSKQYGPPVLIHNHIGTKT